MKKIKFFILVFLFNFSSQTSNATNPISVESYQHLDNSGTFRSENTIFKKSKFWIKKHFENELNPNEIKNLGRASLFFGILALVSFFILTRTTGTNFFWLYGIPAIIGFIGIIIGNITLRITRQSQKENRLSRLFANWGLVFSAIAIMPLFTILFVSIIIYFAYR